MNGSRCRIGGPRRSAVGTGRIRLNSSPSLTRTKGVSREGPCPWRIDGLTNKNLEVEVEVEVEMSMQAGERVGDRALRRQATVKAGKTVVLGMLAAASMGAMGAMQASSQMPFASIALAIPAVSAEALATAFRSAWAGLAAGCLHTLAGADHLAALTPLTIGQSHLRASMLGALWGFGHSTGQLMLGLAMVVRCDGPGGRGFFPPSFLLSLSLSLSLSFYLSIDLSIYRSIHPSPMRVCSSAPRPRSAPCPHVSARNQCSCSRIGLARSCPPSQSGAVQSWV
jgi:hypothetical protein